MTSAGPPPLPLLLPDKDELQAVKGEELIEGVPSTKALVLSGDERSQLLPKLRSPVFSAETTALLLFSKKLLSWLTFLSEFIFSPTLPAAAATILYFANARNAFFHCSSLSLNLVSTYRERGKRMKPVHVYYEAKGPSTCSQSLSLFLSTPHMTLQSCSFVSSVMLFVLPSFKRRYESPSPPVGAQAGDCYLKFILHRHFLPRRNK